MEYNCSLKTCNEADTEEMVACEKCKRWWHFTCVNFNQDLYSTADPWYCEETDCEVREDPKETGSDKETEGDPITGKGLDVVATVDLLLEAAATAQAAAAEKDVELNSLRNELREAKQKLDSVSIPSHPQAKISSISDQAALKTFADKRLDMIKTIQANHQSLLKNLSQHQSTPIRAGATNQESFQDSSSIHHSDMASLLTILNRSNVQELPSFSGSNKREWPYFEEVFKSTTVEGKYNGKENVARLRKALKGEAYQLVSDRLKYSTDDGAIMDSLRSIFGRPDVLVHGLTADLLKLPSLKSKCDPNLHIWAVKLNGFVADLKSINRGDDLLNGYVLTDLSCKLGPGLYQDWRKKQMLTPQVSIEDFANFLTQKVIDLPPELVKPLETSLPRKSQKITNRVLTHQPLPTTALNASCVKCGHKQHMLSECDEFKSMAPETRLSFARERKICFRCLDPVEHDWRSCSKKKTCGLSGCVGRHHPLLHQTPVPHTKELNVSAVPYVPNPNFNSSHIGSKMPVMFKIVPIRIYGKEKFIDTFAFLDDGSSLTMVEKDLFDELGLDGHEEMLTLQWTKGVSRSEESIRTNLAVSGVQNNKRHFLKNVYTVKGLELPVQSIDTSKLKEKYPHLRGLPLTDLVDAKPKILVGLDQAKFLLGHGQRHGKDDEPCALKTLLGWIVYGKSAPMIRATCAQDVAKPTMRFLFHDAIKTEDELHELVKRHFTTEEFGVMPPKGDLVSKEESRALSIMEGTIKYVNNRYEIGLLWSADNIKLPDSYSMALNRLITLEKSLKKKPQLLEWKNNHMQNLLSKGYARIATEEELKKDWPRVWYPPTFVIENPNKFPIKPRDVADFAAKVRGVALNTYLLKGPDNLVSLHAGIFKLRERKIAVNADVKEMFHQIRIKAEDQQCQRVLWRNGDVTKRPTVYIMEVMMFGPRCSPTCAQFVKNFHANKFKDEFPEAVDGLVNRTYVDDYFNSHDTIEEALSVTKDAIQICKSMSFDLVGVQSNSLEFLKQLPQNNVNARLISMDPSESESHVTKVLGLYWLPSSDLLTYRISDDGLFEKMSNLECSITKREILRIIMRIFDPLGLISLYIIRGRIILQDIWREGFDWDEPVSKHLKEQWLIFIKELMGIEKLKIPRLYVSWSPSCSEASLIVFADASEKAFAAVSYFRFEKEDAVEVALVMAKAKVAPVKKLSVPRLELQAAVLGVRLALTVRASHSISIREVIFLSDSRTVLSWINSTDFKFPSFVAVRVGEILDSTTPRQWFHVSSADNVADDATKWSDSSMGDYDARWFKGPNFLKDPFRLWPVKPSNNLEPMFCEPDSSVMVHTSSDKISFRVFDELKGRFKANWGSSVRTIAFILRFIDCYFKRETEKKHFVTPSEFYRAEDWLFRKIQQDVYHEEYMSLRRTKTVESSSSIYTLSPFLDSEGTIRMSSRAQKALISYASRNPAILPKDHPLVETFIKYYHDRNFHTGTSGIISDIRERAWIINIRVAVQRVKSKCNTCKRIAAKPIMPLMGQLPISRLSFDSKPFTHVGVDCFGPLLVKFGRGTAKRYGMIFTCLTFRAVQIELLNDLSLDQCTMALRRFLINRVVTKFLYSDNGLNFIGTKNLLEKDIKEMEEALSEYSAKYEKILWQFIPAYSPWMGGAWERLIQSIKITVEFILKGVVPREDVLRNALIEAQGQINRRPLTHIPVDPEDPRPLTPNSMLFGDDDRNVTAPGVFYESDINSRLYSRRAQHLMMEFTKRWYTEYLPEIARRSKWHKNIKPVVEGSIVILVEPNDIRESWKMGRVTKVYPGPDGVVRICDVRLPNGAIRLKRSVGRLAVLDVLSSS
ncbi:uncharacterized protein LOC129912027 [Episyrphus balteatus]|uniref:uncharacterized protein LOC129912027 n=1 Tax=Episyrphus balteatus TaxID=286459 RepID=UPI002484E275|nr:uncharacterized protein LOC129912027 [Episyrphus balteatus]